MRFHESLARLSLGSRLPDRAPRLAGHSTCITRLTYMVRHWEVVFVGFGKQTSLDLLKTHLSPTFTSPSEIRMPIASRSLNCSANFILHGVSAQPQHHPIVSRTPHFAWRCGVELNLTRGCFDDTPPLVTRKSWLCDHRVTKIMPSLQGLHREYCFRMFR